MSCLYNYYLIIIRVEKYGMFFVYEYFTTNCYCLFGFFFVEYLKYRCSGIYVV